MALGLVQQLALAAILVVVVLVVVWVVDGHMALAAAQQLAACRVQQLELAVALVLLVEVARMVSAAAQVPACRAQQLAATLVAHLLCGSGMLGAWAALQGMRQTPRCVRLHQVRLDTPVLIWLGCVGFLLLMSCASSNTLVGWLGWSVCCAHGQQCTSIS